MRYLLDTNMVSDLIRNPDGRVAERLRTVGADNICTSIIVAAEARYGAARKASPKLLARVEEVLERIEVLPLRVPADRVYGRIRCELERVGLPIGGNDLFIAAQGLAIGCTLVTANEREFSCVPGLSVENWLSSSD